MSKSRLFGEKISQTIWQFENLGYFEGNQVDRINQLSFNIPDIIKDLFHVIRKSGNKASHDGTGSFKEALFILKKCHQLAIWFYKTYEDDNLKSKEYKLPDSKEESLDELTTKLTELSKEIIDYKAKIDAINATPAIITERKERSERNASNITKTEAETRYLIDQQLRIGCI